MTNAADTQSVVDLLAGEDAPSRIAVARALLKDAGVSVGELLALEDDDAIDAPIAAGILVKSDAGRRPLAMKPDDTAGAPIAAEAATPAPNTVRPMVTGNAADWQKKQQAPTPTLILTPLPKHLTPRQQAAVEKGARWTTYRDKRAQLCYGCETRRGDDRPDKLKKIVAGMRYVYWPMAKQSADGSVTFESFFFHPDCWTAEHAAAAGIPVTDPNPAEAIKTTAEAAASSVTVTQAASPLPGQNVPASEIAAQAIREAALATVKSPMERMAADLVAVGSMAKSLGFEKLDAEAVATIASLAHALRNLNDAFRPSRSTDD